MALRERPFSQFNFTVTFSEGGPEAGFQEVSGIGLEITVAEYRPGNYGQSSPMKITGMHKVPDVTFKRGVMGAQDLYNWIKAVRDGSQDQRRTVTIELLSEDRETTAQSWVLTDARPIKYTGPALNGKGTDVAVEELVVACERIDFGEAAA